MHTPGSSLAPTRPSPVAPEHATFKSGDVLASRFKVLSYIGCGPLGQVYRALDQEMDITVAVKAISPRLMQTVEERKSFSREIRLARKLNHPNLIRVYDDGVENNWPFFTMQLLEGLTLRRIINLRREKNERFRLRELEPIFTQIAAALEAAHEIGPHCGVKPENIVILPDELKLTDFGLGMALPRLPFVAAQRSCGTHAYLAPEFSAGHDDVDAHADIYAMGVIMGEMLSGVLPDGSQVPDPRSKRPELPAQVTALYRRALNENPLCRPAKPSDFVKELSSIISEFPEDGPEASPIDIEDAIEIDGEEAPGDDEPTPPAGLSPEDGSEGKGDGVRTSKPTEASDGSPAGAHPPETPQKSGKFVVDLASAKPSQLPKKKGGSLVPMAVVVSLTVAALLGAGYTILGRMLRQQPSAPTPAAPTQPAPVVTIAPQIVSPDQPPAAASQDPATPTPAPAAVAAIPPPPAVASSAGAAQPSAGKDASQKPASADLAQAFVSAASVKAAADVRQGGDNAQPDKDSGQATASAREEQKPAADASQTQPQSPEPDRKTAEKGQPQRQSGGTTCPDKRMKYIPAGTFSAGTAENDPMRGFGERPLQKVKIPAYCIDVYEFPNRRGAMPKGKISYQLAEAACEKEGKRLCTENEWERACKGPLNHVFPYDSTFQLGKCNTQAEGGTPQPLKASGGSRYCVSGYDVYDLSGNVAEWTSTPYTAKGTGKVIKGGAANRPDHASRCSARRNGPTNKPETDDMVGFRCCADPVRK